MKFRLSHLMIAGIVCMVTLGVTLLARAGQSFTIEYEIDRPGLDYNYFATSRMEDCLNACLRDGQCKAFTYVSAGYQPPDFSNQQPICWLKNAVPSRNRGTGMVSGVKQ